jgi:uncharacterized membrane protein YoaK (UPF0700 family)
MQISIKNSPSTAVMTTNTTRFVIDLGDILLGRSRNDRVKAGERAKRTGFAIVGFALGCSLGAGCQVVTGLWSLALPAGVAQVALAIAVAAKLDGSQAQPLIPASSRGSLERRRPQGHGQARESLVGADCRRHEDQVSST